MAGTRTLRSTPASPASVTVLGARVLAEFGDDPHRYHDAKSPQELRRHLPDHPRLRHADRSCWPATPATAASATPSTSGPSARSRGSPGARAYYDTLRARGIGHHAALRQLGNRLVGILHGCLKTGTLYDEHTAWAHHTPAAA